MRRSHPAAGRVAPRSPLFVDSDSRVRGCDVGSVLQAQQAGPGVIAGWPRGHIPDSHYTPAGFRTNGVSSLWCVGDAWSLGPGVGGWAAVRRLTVQVGFTLHDGTDWHGIGLCGVQGPNNYCNPQPWQLYCADGKVWFAIRTAAGVFQFGFVIPVGATEIDATFDADLVTGAVSGTLGAPTLMHGPLPQNSYLAGNAEHGFSVGRLTPFAGSTGYFADAYRDLTVRDIRVNYNGVEACRYYPGTRRQTYPGGLSLPLAAQWPGRHFLSHHKDQPQFAAGIELDGIQIVAWPFSPGIAFAGISGGLSIDGCRVSGGTRAVTSLESAVAYPLHIRGGRFEGQSDCGVFLYRAGYGTIRDVQIAYARRCSLHLIGCHLSVSGTMEAPPGVPAECFARQSGGQVEYNGCGGDYESAHGGYRMFRIEPASWDFPWFPTETKIDKCFFRARHNELSVVDPDLVEVLPPLGGYVGETRVTVDGAVVHADNI